MVDAPLSEALAETFGFRALRPGQAEVIADVMAGRPVVAVMPTGAGKSLCYQLPAVVLGREGHITLVVSPLIALMKDQVDGLREQGVAAAHLTSASDSEDQAATLEALRDGSLRLLYVAPERFRSGRFLAALESVRSRIGLFAIDEAHCISEWGHDFRPDYRRLGQVVRELRPPRIVALTATATPEVREDIIVQLGLEDARLYVRGFARPSLRLSVAFAAGNRDKCDRLIDLVRACPGPSLVYAATRKNAEAYASHLGSAGIKVRVYHAGLEDDERHRAQDEFMDGDVRAIVATNAFGMGVDKADIRLVVHADLPRSPEAYYQEAGRAGRDGQGADCVVLFNHADVKLQEFLIDASNPAPDLLREVWRAIRQSPHVGSDVQALREHLAGVPAMGGAPSRAAVDSAVRILSRTGYLEDTMDGPRAVKPVPGAYPELDPEGMIRRAAAEHHKLSCLVEYSYHTGCRQRFLLAYFGDQAVTEGEWSCGVCDVCTGSAEIEQADEARLGTARSLLELAGVLSGRLGRGRLVGVARGTEDGVWGDAPGAGSLSGSSEGELLDLCKALEAAGYLERSRGEYPTLGITARGRRVVAGVDTLDDLGIHRGGGGKRARRARASEPTGPVDDALRGRLRDLRARLSSELGVPAYRIFSNKTLDALSIVSPQEMDALAAIPGIGPAKLEAFGEQILSTIRG